MKAQIAGRDREKARQRLFLIYDRTRRVLLPAGAALGERRSNPA
jgi:hypothetical protein